MARCQKAKVCPKGLSVKTMLSAVCLPGHPVWMPSEASIFVGNPVKHPHAFYEHGFSNDVDKNGRYPRNQFLVEFANPQVPWWIIRPIEEAIGIKFRCLVVVGQVVVNYKKFASRIDARIGGAAGEKFGPRLRHVMHVLWAIE